MSRVSLIINNYNYGRFLRQCLDSCLDQSVRAHEVIVVDDGSTDDSREILKEYSGLVKIVLKENGGQGSAMNAGFAASSGDWIWFVDSDDWLHPDSVKRIFAGLSPGFTRVQGWLETIDEAGRQLGIKPKSLKVREEILPVEWIERGSPPPFPPTSGNVFSREFLSAVFPVPEEEFRICADEYLVYADFRRQRILHLPVVVAYRRSHGANAELKNTLFFTDRKSALLALETIHRTRRHMLLQFPEFAENPVDYPYPLNHLKSMAIIQRILPERRNELPLDRAQLKRAFRIKLKRIQSLTERLKQEFSYLVLVYAPLWFVNFVGSAESTWRDLKAKKVRQS